MREVTCVDENKESQFGVFMNQSYLNCNIISKKEAVRIFSVTSFLTFDQRRG